MPLANDDIPAGLTQRLVVVTEVGVLVLLGGLLRRQAIGRAVRQTAR